MQLSATTTCGVGRWVVVRSRPTETHMHADALSRTWLVHGGYTGCLLPARPPAPMCLERIAFAVTSVN